MMYISIYFYVIPVFSDDVRYGTCIVSIKIIDLWSALSVTSVLIANGPFHVKAVRNFILREVTSGMYSCTILVSQWKIH